MRCGLAQHLAAAFVAVFVIVPIAWMAMDREPPHSRSDGAIVAAPPNKCGLPDDTPLGILPGSCVKVKWRIHRIRNCAPSAEFNVTRSLWSKASGEERPLPPSSSRIGEIDEQGNLVRFFALPALIPFGQTVYKADACFSCNPLHSLLHLPVCVTGPNIDFEIVKP